MMLDVSRHQLYEYVKYWNEVEGYSNHNIIILLEHIDSKYFNNLHGLQTAV